MDPTLSNHAMDVSVHSTNTHCLIRTKDIQIKQAFVQYCLKHTWDRILRMQPTSVCVFGGGTRLKRSSSEMMQRTS